MAGHNDIYEINLNGFDIATGGKVLKASSYATFAKCKDIIFSVKEKCDILLQEAQKKCDDIIHQAHEQAVKIQFDADVSKKEQEKRGYEEGMEQGKQEIANTMMDFVTKSSSSFSKLESDVTDVVKMALRKIIGKIDKQELIVSVVKNSLQKIKMQKHATLKVAPVDAPLLRDKITELTQDTPMIEFLDVCADAHLQQGSCILETELGVIDASIPVQLEAIENALINAKS